MYWRAVKQAARDIVHKTMGLCCTYRYDDETPVPCTVRHHRKTAFVGDDIEEFNPGLLSQINRVIVDLREVPNPRRNATLTFEDGTVLKIETTVQQGEYYVMCEVKP